MGTRESRGHGLDHSEKCRKYRQQVENLKIDLEELQEKYDNVVKEKASLIRKYEKVKASSSFLNSDWN